MKRILAVFLTLAMALNIAPVAAFAAADSDAASIVAVEETDETSSPQLDEETAKAIASDPFLQAAYAQTEQDRTGGGGHLQYVRKCNQQLWSAAGKWH